MKTRPRRALGYIRVSTQRQADEGISMTNQDEQLRAYCLRNDIELVEVHSDGGYSATHGNRPGLQAMFAAAMRPGSAITEVVVYSFSRLFRDNFLLEDYRRKLKRSGVRLIAITQEVGDDAEGDLVRGVLSKFDEYQSAQTGKFTRDSMRKNARAGFWNGGVVPFGYRTEVAEMCGTKAKKRLVIEEPEALLVKQIYKMKRVGVGQGPMGYKKIVTHLNAVGTTLRGRKFHVSNVREILTRRTYFGAHPYGIRDTRGEVDRPEEEWETIPVPVIIEEAEWLEVQAGICRNASHITPARIVSGPTMLAGIAKCGQPGCGHALTIATGKGGRYRYYRCSRRLRRGETVCPGISIRDKALETVVIEALADRILRPERLKVVLSDLLDQSIGATQERREHLTALKTERTRVGVAMQNMFDFIEQGVVSARDADFASRLAGNRARRHDLDQNIALVEQQLSAERRVITPEAVGRLGDVLVSKFRQADSSVRQGYARRFINEVVVAADLITITGSVKALERAASNGPEAQAPLVPSSAREWCATQSAANLSQHRLHRLNRLFCISGGIYRQPKPDP